MIVVRPPETLYPAKVPVENGFMQGRWHFSFDTYRDPEWTHLGTLRVFNDDTLSPGAVWPLHPHREIEVVTYCADGEFRHADENGVGGVLKKGWVQHTTVGRGMWHSELNNRKDAPMRFIQMWFFPSAPGLEPSVEQKPVERAKRTNRLLPLVTDEGGQALQIFSDARVYAAFLEKGQAVRADLEKGHSGYVLAVDGGPIAVNKKAVPTFGAAKAVDERALDLKAEADGEILLVDAGPV